MLHRKIKKGDITALISVVILIVALVITMERVLGESIWSTSESFNLYNKYFTLTMDKQIQSLKQGFEKTAAFFSLNSASKELAEHGGFARETLMDSASDSNSNNIVDATEDLEPKILIKQDLESGESIPFWTIPNCQTTLKRVPYLMDEDVNRVAGNIAIPLMQNDVQHMQYITEINEGKYPLYISIQLFMMKPGEVTFACHSMFGCNNIEALPGTPEITDTVATDVIVTNAIRKDGIYSYKIDNINPDKPLSLHVFAKNESGELDDVARIKQVTVSIYDPQTFTTPNKLFTRRLNEYHTELNTILVERNKREKIKIKISPLTGTMTKGKEDYAEGIVWPDENADSITSYMDNPFFKKKKLKLAELRDSGIITEETKIRYYTLYDNAEKFTDVSQQMLQSRLWVMLHEFDQYGHFEGSADQCGYPNCMDPNWCLSDPVQSYTRDEIYSEISDTLDEIALEFGDIEQSDGMTWLIKLDEADYAEHGTTNVNKPACMSSDPTADRRIYRVSSRWWSWRGGGTSSAFANTYIMTDNFHAPEYIESENFEYAEYIDATYEYLYRDPACCAAYQCHGCGSTSYNYQNRNRCTMHYDHRYILKNLSIYVKITDEDYKIYDTATNTWENPEFKFYVTVPIVDMNCCGDLAATPHKCDDHTTPCTNPYGSITVAYAFASHDGPLEIISPPTTPSGYAKDTSTALSWETNKPSTCIIKYWPVDDTTGTKEVADTSEVVAHIVTISGLEPSKEYNCKIESRAGSETHTSGTYSFTTNADQTPPEIEFIKPSFDDFGKTSGPSVYVEVDAKDNGMDRVVLTLYYDKELTDNPAIETCKPPTPAHGCHEGKLDDKLDEVPLSGPSPYSHTFNILDLLGSSFRPGNFRIEATAYDALDNSASADVIVNVVEEIPDIEIKNIEESTTSYTATVKWTSFARGVEASFEYCYENGEKQCSATDPDEVDLQIKEGEEGAYVHSDGEDPNAPFENFKRDITGLSPYTTYSYTIRILPNGCMTPTEHPGTFTTLAKPPEISNLQVVVAPTAATISWNTGLQSSCTLSVNGKNPTSEGTSHEITVDGLTSETNYNYEITCSRADGRDADLATEKDKSFTTTAA